MADNYLENKMAEHLARRNGGVRPAAGPRHGVLQLPYAPRRVLVAGADEAIAAACARRFRDAGCRVARLGGEATEGVRCYGCDAAQAIAALMHDWHEIDLLVLAGAAPEAEEALRVAREAIPAPLRSARAATIAINTAGVIAIEGNDAVRAAEAALLLSVAPPAEARIVLGS